jgi:hypothetical protein
MSNRRRCSQSRRCVLELRLPEVISSGQPPAEGARDRKQFAHLPYPPFVFGCRRALTMGRSAHRRLYRGKSGDCQRLLRRGTGSQIRDVARRHPVGCGGADCTRVVPRVTDEFGNVRPLANDAINLQLTGPATLIGAIRSCSWGRCRSLDASAGARRGGGNHRKPPIFGGEACGKRHRTRVASDCMRLRE